ncbi:hypothetical protein C2E23DRAFT_285052 [Lenzites betulinus]|nr:hypothetical protein C2E23DRAFT_285052 [Lenzites betulinus]
MTRFERFEKGKAHVTSARASWRTRTLAKRPSSLSAPTRTRARGPCSSGAFERSAAEGPEPEATGRSSNVRTRTPRGCARCPDSDTRARAARSPRRAAAGPAVYRVHRVAVDVPGLRVFDRGAWGCCCCETASSASLPRGVRPNPGGGPAGLRAHVLAAATLRLENAAADGRAGRDGRCRREFVRSTDRSSERSAGRESTRENRPHFRAAAGEADERMNSEAYEHEHERRELGRNGACVHQRDVCGRCDPLCARGFPWRARAFRNVPILAF